MTSNFPIFLCVCRSLLNSDFLTFTPISTSSGTESSRSALKNLVRRWLRAIWSMPKAPGMISEKLLSSTKTTFTSTLSTTLSYHFRDTIPFIRLTKLPAGITTSSRQMGCRKRISIWIQSTEFKICLHSSLLLIKYSMWYDFHNFRTYGLNGIYRHMMSKPSDLKWKFLNYDDPDQSLITSDLNRLTKIASPPVDLPGIISSSWSNSLISLCFLFG